MILYQFPLSLSEPSYILIYFQKSRIWYYHNFAILLLIIYVIADVNYNFTFHYIISVYNYLFYVCDCWCEFLCGYMGLTLTQKN